LTGSILIERVAALLAPLLPEQSAVLIGLSGGADSVVLLHILHRLAPRYSWKLSALHVHHGLSPNADAWADFCADLCARHDIPLHIEQVDIEPLRVHGIEAAARRLRHAAFAKQPCDFVALAHHADDQAETLLLQLLRGAGVKGASAMPIVKEALKNASIHGDASTGSAQDTQSVSNHEQTPHYNQNVADSALRYLRANGINQGIINSTVQSSSSEGDGREDGRKEDGALRCHAFVRPLLHCSRQQILDYAAAYDLRWIEDESNADESYPRNFLRHRVLPQLGEKFPAYRETLGRSAQHFAEASELLDDLARLDAAKALRDGTLAVAALALLSPPRAKNLLRYFLHQCGAPMPQAVQLDDMLHQLCDARADASLCVAYGGWQVRRYRGRVHVMPELGEFDRQYCLTWQGEDELDWPALGNRIHFKQTVGQGISLEKLRRAAVTLRLRNGGESLRPHANAATRTLKNLLQEHHIPPWHRDRLPLLYCGDELVCVPGRFDMLRTGMAVAAEYQVVSDDENGLVLAAL